MKIVNGRYRLGSQLNSSYYYEIYQAEDTVRDQMVELVMIKPTLTSSSVIESIIDRTHYYLHQSMPGLCRVHEIDVVRDIDDSKRYQIQYFYTREPFTGEQGLDYSNLSRDQIVSVLLELILLVRRFHQLGESIGLLNFDHFKIVRREDGVHALMIDTVLLTLRRNLFFEQDEIQAQFRAPEAIYDNAETQFSDYYSLAKIVFYIFFKVDYRSCDFSRELTKYSDSRLIELIGRMASNLESERQKAFDSLHKLLYEMIEQDVLRSRISVFDYLNLDAFHLDKRDNLKVLKQAVIARYNFESPYNGFFVSGGPGTGKTRLMGELRTFLNLKRIKTVWIDRTRLTEGSKTLIGCIVTQLGLEDLKPLVVQVEQAQTDSEELRLTNRLMNHVLDQIKFKPAVVMIDEVAFLKPHEIKMLNYYLNTNQTSPLSFVLATDPETFDHAFVFGQRDQRVMTVDLSDFDYAETLMLIKNLMGIGKQSDELISELMQETQGNPKRLMDALKERIHTGRLYLNEELDWFEKREDRTISLSGGIETERILDHVATYDGQVREVLELLSIFDFAIDAFYISNIFEISQKRVAEIIETLLGEGVIEERIGDRGYTYEYSDRLMRLVVRNHIPSSRYIMFNEKAAEQIKQHATIGNYQMNQYLIYHYKESHQYEQALNLCLRVAADMGRTQLVSQQIKYLEMASEINAKRGRESDNIIIYRKLSEIHMQRGNNALAVNLIDRAVEIARTISNRSAYYDAIFIKMKLLLRYNQVEDVEGLVESLIGQMDPDIPDENFFKMAYVKAKVLYSKNQLKELLAYTEKMLAKARSMEYSEFVAYFANEYGIALSKNGRSDEAIVEYETSYELFIEIGNHVEASRPLNNIGVEYIESLGDFTKAREYFLKGLHVVDNVQDSFERIIYLNNVAETHYFMGEYEQALDYLKRAESIVRVSQHSNFGFNVYMTLFNVYRAMNRYDIAFGYYNKLENEIRQSHDRGVELREYYYAVIEFFLEIRDFITAEEYLIRLNRIQGEENDEPVRKEILRYKIVLFKSQLFNRGQQDNIRLIEHLIERIGSHLDALYLRRFIYETVMNLFYTNKITEIQHLMNLDSDLSETFDSPVLSLQRRMMVGVLEPDRIAYYMALSEEALWPGLSWRLEMIIGKELFFTGKPHLAFDHLFKALGVTRQLMNLIPLEFRERFIFYDFQKIDLRNFIVSAMAKVLGHHILEDEKIYHEFTIEPLDQFFHFRNYQHLVSHAEMVRYDDRLKFSSITDLINAFDYNVYDNIKMILEYLLEFCNADLAGIYIYDLNNTLVEVIGDDEMAEEEINRILKNFYGTDGILINDFLRIGNANYLPAHLSALMLIPLKPERMSGINRRVNSSRNAYNSYLVLSADKPFNNFTQRSFEEVLKLNRFIYQYVEKYFLNSFFTVDKTTGVFMRSHVEESIHQEIYYSKLTDRRFAVAMSDIDKFKEINDSYGHKKGDDVLATIGQIMTETLRETDIVGRYGGEEFIIFLPNTDHKTAYDVVERVRNQIAEHQFTGLNRTITMSFGISGYPDHSETLEELIEKADQALYVSKDTGRNRVTLWDSGSIEDHKHYTKWEGIFSASEIVNIRSAKGILELIELHRLEDRQLKRTEMVRIVMQMTGARYCTVSLDEGTCLSMSSGDETLSDQNLFDPYVIEDYREGTEGDYFVDWRSFTEVNPESGKMSWRSIIVMPIIIGQKRKGMLLLGVPVYEKEFEYGDYNLISRIVPLIGSII